MSDNNRLEARKIIKEFLGRRLKSYECVHHIDGNPNNNKFNNLQLMKRSKHTKLHHKQGDLHIPTKDEAKRGWHFVSLYTDEELLNEIRRIAKLRLSKYGRFTARIFNELSFTGITTIKRRFGTWNKAKIFADIEY